MEKKYYLVNIVVEVPVIADSVKEAYEIAKWALANELKPGNNLNYKPSSALMSDKPLDYCYTGDMLTMVLYK